MKANPPVFEFETQFDGLFAAIKKYFCLRGFDANTAADLTAEVFEHSLLARNGYDARKASMKTWLFAIARNLSVNAWKAAQNPAAIPGQVTEEFPDPDPTLEEKLLRREEQRELIKALGILDERAREVVSLKFAARLNNREIAALTGISEGNVAVILYRALRQVKGSLSKEQSEEQHE